MSAPDFAMDGRRWSRHKIDIRLKVTARMADGATEAVFGRGNSLSQGGLGAYIPASISVGSIVTLELIFPYSENQVRVKAAVRNTDGFRYGLEFFQVPSDIQQIIRESCSAAEATQIG